MIIDIPKIFEGQVVTILGGGYSLKDFDWSRVKGKTVAVNLSVFNYPDADICVGLDSGFFERYEFFKSYNGILITDRGDPNYLYPGATMLKYEGVAWTNGDRDIDWHCQSANLGGFVAVALTFHLGAKKVYLLGYDGGYDTISNHYYHNEKIASNVYEGLNWHYEYFKDYDVVNVGLGSRIPYFKKVDINSNFYE